jgi:hypothetical protein
VVSNEPDNATPSLLITMLILIILSALAAMGVAYGLWSQTLTIGGVVQTGEVDAKWTFAGCFEFYPWPEGGNFGEVEDKDVGSWDVWIDPQDDQILHFHIENGYPSYAVDCSVKYQVEGTIPVIMRGTIIYPTSDNLHKCTLTGNYTKTLTCDELTVIFSDNLGSQLHPGDVASSNLMVHVEQLADENASYDFEVLVCMAQWNEEATARQCFEAER